MADTNSKPAPKLGMFQSTETVKKQFTCPVTGKGAEFKPFDDTGYITNPYPFLKSARAEEPIFYSPEVDAWVVTKYDDVQAVFKDPKTFSASIARHPVTPMCPAAAAKRDEYDISIEQALVDEDPQTHIKHRRIFGEAFTPKRVNEIEPQIREIVTRHIDRFIDKGEADLVADLMYTIPALTVFIFLGIDDANADMIKDVAGPRGVVNFGKPTDEEQVTMMESIGKSWQFTKDFVDAALDNPGDNYLGDMVRLYHEDNSLFSINYLYNVMFVMQFAGHETTTMTTSSGLRELLQNPIQWQALCDDPSLIPNAVEEILRYEPSIFGWRRLTTKEVTLGGHTIPEGETILLMTGSANRDEALFNDGEVFDITRENAKKHLTLGFGAHFCMGAPLARLQMRIVLEELTRRIPQMKLVEEQSYPSAPTLILRGPEKVLVSWDVT